MARIMLKSNNFSIHWYRRALLGLMALGLVACGGGGGGGVVLDESGDEVSSYTVTPSVGTGGSISPATAQTVNHGATTSFTITPDTGYSIDAVDGTCGGSLDDNTYTTSAITADCTVQASFSLINYTTVSPTAGANGSISPATAQTIQSGNITVFTVTPDAGYGIDSVSGCGGDLDGNTYVTGVITSDCSVAASFILLLPPAPTLSLTPTATKTFRFSWADVSFETEYRLLENPDGASGYTQVATIVADATSHDLVAFLPARINASYMLQACNSGGCSDSAAVSVSGTLAEAVGYVKASNTAWGDQFGIGLALSADGNTLAVGAPLEDSDALDSGAVYVFTRSGSNWSQQAYVKAPGPGMYDWFGTRLSLAADGNTLAVGAPLESNNATDSGAVYVFTRSGSAWSQQAYVKASNIGGGDEFGRSVALSADGNTLAVGAPIEESNATGIDGDQADDSVFESGAVYVFTRSGGTWSQQAYVKASNTGEGDLFGISVALAADGNTLAVGAYDEDSDATGSCVPGASCDTAQVDNSASNSGAVYVFTRSDSTWSQQAYVKASNTGEGDRFGWSVALAADGNTLAVGAYKEGSNATGIDGDQADNSVFESGAVYVFTRSDGIWSQQAYVKASSIGWNDWFGISVALAADGNTLAVGAYNEDSNATGIDGDQTDSNALDSGVVYVFTRSGGTWSQQAYVKASNTGEGDLFGISVALAADGNTLAVGAINEDSSATGINGNQNDNSASNSGVVYLY